jgi:hypothetical protein
MGTPVGKRTVGGSKPLPPSGPAGDEQEEPQTRRASSKADAFNSQASATGMSVPVGNYVGHIVAAKRTVEDEPSQKEFIKIDYEVAEGEHEGKVVPAWYNLFNKEGVPQRGGEFFKRDVVTLGVREEGKEPTYEEIDQVLEEIADARPLCNFTCKLNNGYYNIFLQGLAEG